MRYFPKSISLNPLGNCFNFPEKSMEEPKWLSEKTIHDITNFNNRRNLVGVREKNLGVTLLFGDFSKTFDSISSSSSCHAASTDIPDPLLPLFPIVHRLWQIFRATSRILTHLLYVCSSRSSCFSSAICGGP